jgi:hypothetical protein
MNQDPKVLLKEAHAALTESMRWVEPTDELECLLMNIEDCLGMPHSKDEIDDESDVVAMTIDQFLDSLMMEKR